MTVWVIEAREEIAVIAGVRASWHLDPTAGAFTDYELVAEEAYRRNQAERRLLEAQHEQQYQERLAAWRRATAARLAETNRSDWLPSPTKPQRTRYIHTDTYRVSRSLQVHVRA